MADAYLVDGAGYVCVGHAADHYEPVDSEHCSHAAALGCSAGCVSSDVYSLLRQRDLVPPLVLPAAGASCTGVCGDNNQAGGR